MRHLSIIIFLLLVYVKVFSQTNNIITIENGKFYKDCIEFTPICINYGVTVNQFPQGLIFPSPDINTFNQLYTSANYCNTWSHGMKRIRADFQMIKDLNFNTIRITGLSINEMNYTLKFHTKKFLNGSILDDYLFLNDYYYEYLNIIDSIFTVANEFDLKIIFLVKGGQIVLNDNVYLTYLNVLSNRFKNNTALFAYDLYNEPSWLSNFSIESKSNINLVTSQWYNAIRINDNHLITIGTEDYNYCFNWDPIALKIDFYSFHLYPTDNSDLETYKIYLSLVKEVLNKPFIIGEIGFPAHNNTYCTTIEGTENDQANFIFNTLNIAFDYGSKGYSFWNYHDASNCSSMDSLCINTDLCRNNYTGIVKRGIPNGYFDISQCTTLTTPTTNPNLYIEGELKAGALIFKNYTYTPSVNVNVPSSIYSKFNGNYIAAKGYIKNSSNNPIKWAVIRLVDNWTGQTFYTYSDQGGYFEIKNSSLSLGNTIIDVTYPGMSREYIPVSQSISTTILDFINVDNISYFNDRNIVVDNNSALTWNTNMNNIESIIIKNNSQLTINLNVLFLPSGNIIIEKGGKLVIDGGTISSDCKMWQGILVQGNPSYDQTDESKQGVLEMKNGATIKNAEVAIYVGQYFVPNSQSSIGSNYGNGIIKIENSNFLNNQKDIVIRPNVLSLIGSGNITFFSRNYVSNCTFKNDANMLTDAILNKGKMESINLNGVFKINMIGNTFENLDNSISLSENWDAIVAQNSGLIIEAGSNTIPNNYNDPNQFINLRSGVRAINSSGSSNLISINHCEFTNTYHSIFLSGTNNAEVLLNNIQVPDQALSQSGQPDPGAPYGIYLNGGRGFRVEENTLWRPSSSGPELFNGARGIIVHNTGGVNNEIYMNTTNNLFISEQAQMYNSGKGVNAALGLKYLCNTSQTSQSSYDFQIFGNWYVAMNKPFQWSLHQSGIAEFQQQSNLGNIQNPYLPAGNQFSTDHLTNGTSVFDFDNADALRVKYGWGNLTSTGEKWKPTDYANIENKYIAIPQGVNVCPSKINSGGNGSTLTQLYANLGSAYSAYNSSRLIFNIWKDGGNIELGEEVATTDPWDVYIQFNSLIAESPYLSEEVILEFINNEAFSSLMVKLLIISNPHAGENPMIMKALENRIPAMPQSYIEEIRNQPEVSSQYKVLEGNMAADYHLITSIGEEIKRIYKSDNGYEWEKDSLINFVSRQPDLYDKYELATLYLSFSLYDDMQNVLNSIPSTFELNDEASEEFSKFCTVINIAKEMQQNDAFENGLSDTDRASLEAILAENYASLSPLALSLLFRDNPTYLYSETIFDVEENYAPRARPNQETIVQLPAGNYTIFPNPAYDYTTLSYNCKFSNMSYTILDMQGKTIKTSALASIEDLITNEVLINLKGMSKGTYQVIVKTNDLTLWSEKLVISE